MAKPLNSGDLFPEFRVATTTGSELCLPGDLNGDYAVLIFYRGHW